MARRCGCSFAKTRKPRILPVGKNPREPISLYDTTLRDGTQGENISFSADEKVKIAERLDNTEDTDIYLAFTHGDFSFVNFQDNNGRIAVIDWESAQLRSALHDLYNYYFTELYYGRTRSDLLTEIDSSVLSLSQRLAADNPALSRNVAKLGNVYRWLYYLERLHMLLEREMSEGQLKVIRHSADTFGWHEFSLYDQ